MTAHARALPEALGAVAIPPRPLTLGLLTPHNTLDRQAFSGTAFHAAKALKDTPGLTCRLLGAHHRTPRALDRFFHPRPSPARIAPADLKGLDIVDAMTFDTATGPITSTVGVMISAEFGPPNDPILLIDQREITS